MLTQVKVKNSAVDKISVSSIWTEPVDFVKSGRAFAATFCLALQQCSLRLSDAAKSASIDRSVIKMYVGLIHVFM